MLQMQIPRLFNPHGNDKKESRQIWFGDTTNLMNLNNVRYDWAIALYRQMRENFWVAEKLDITQDVTDYQNLTKSERRAFDGILSYLTFLDSIQTCNIPYLKEAITAPEISLCMGEQISQECFDDQTEILTNTGWKFFNCLEKNDLVAQYSLIEKTISLITPSRFIERDYDGIMVNFESGHTSICVTPNHELINIHPVTKVSTKGLAKDTKGGNYSYPKTGKFISTGQAEVSALTKLLVAVAADGTVRVFDKTNVVTANAQLHLTKQRKIDRLEKLLSDLRISFTKTMKTDKSWRYSFTLPIVIDQESIKSLKFINPFFLTESSANVLLSELLFWDGTQERQFYSTNKNAVDTFQIVAMIASKNATIGINRTEEQSRETSLPNGHIAIKTHTCYVASISNCQEKRYPHPVNVPYRGKVYCVTVPDGNIVTRRNGKIAIAGNCLHSQSYQYIIETIIPSDRRQEIYDFWKTDDILRERCEFIANYYQEYVDSPTEDNYLTSLMANYLLESLYFYQGFIFYYNLSSRQLMSGCADIFRMINRDELSHVRLYQKLIVEAKRIFPCFPQQIEEMFQDAVDHEIRWANHIIGSDVLGITPESIDQYTKYLANIRLKAIGLEIIYPEDKYKKSPYSHLEKFSDTQGQGHTKANFFESTVTSYIQSSGVSGWEF